MTASQPIADADWAYITSAIAVGCCDNVLVRSARPRSANRSQVRRLLHSRNPLLFVVHVHLYAKEFPAGESSFNSKTTFCEMSRLKSSDENSCCIPLTKSGFSVAMIADVPRPRTNGYYRPNRSDGPQSCAFLQRPPQTTRRHSELRLEVADEM